MTHEEAFKRLPDLLDDRDDPEVLEHVRACADCQRQLFLLGRVDRLLRDDAAHEAPARRVLSLRVAIAAGVGIAASVAATLVLVLAQGSSGERFVLRTPEGQSVAQATMGHGDTQNDSLALSAHSFPMERGHQFVLWASDSNAEMQVGHFMVDASGRCNVRFNLPATHPWSRFWVTPRSNTAVVVAATT